MLRKVSALTVALLIGLPLFAPLFSSHALAAVPACCRLKGQHHCMGDMMQVPGSDQVVAVIGPRCPGVPVSSLAPQAPGFVAGDAGSNGVALFVRAAALPQTEARYRIAFARSRQKRGPPVVLS